MCRRKSLVELYQNKKIEKTLENHTNGRAALYHYLLHPNAVNRDTFLDLAKEHLQQLLQLNYPNEVFTQNDILNYLNWLNQNHGIEVQFPPNENSTFTFIDLFAGIGGFRLALQELGGQCVFTSEWDFPAKKTYKNNFGDYPFGDITLEQTKDFIPDTFDVLCAGFPCQAFSIAGKRGGFEDTRGTLFFDVAEIIRRKQPRAFFLENVKGLRNHDQGRTLDTILNVLRNDLGYFVPEPEIVNAKNFGVPQNRERIYIVGFHPELGVTDFNYPEPYNEVVAFENVKEREVVSSKYYLSTQYLKTLINHKARHEGKGNGFGYEIIEDDGIANAVVCGGMGRERNLVYDHRLEDFTPVTKIKGEVNREGIRKMTPWEWSQLQGFPENFVLPDSDTQAYKQFGNSVAVPAIKETARQILNELGFF